MNTALPGGLNIEQFRFLTHRYDPANGEAVLAYSFDDGEAIFERFRFPYAPWPSEPSRQAAFDRALGLLHLVAGVSYYKACVPKLMDVGDHRIGEQLAGFLNRLYILGLGEFAWQNRLDLEGWVNFPVNATGEGTSLQLDLPERALIAMGGGKDSLVSLELLRDCGMAVQPVCVGRSKLIKGTAKAAGLPLIQIERTLSPALAKMNEAGALNGHVPVTAINSAVLLCAAILYGYRFIVFSNESSADEPTITDVQGREVNHQYSKSLDFERGLRDVISREISSGIEYFSLLRPLNELAIAERFSQLRDFHGVFSSCNRNFHRDGPRISGLWCGDCPKCRFTTLALASFMAPEDIIGFTGTDLLDLPEQEEGFRALCRLGVEKPFECVGSINECRAAMLRLGTLDGWRDKAIVRKLLPELNGLEVPPFESLLSSRDEHCIPSQVLHDVAV